jgi:uncharacterized damage-inducible protein DinB
MTDTAAAPTARPPAFGDLEHELANTRRVLERVPDEHWDWQPHEKSMTLGRIAGHLATLPWLGTQVLETDELDVRGAPRPPAPANREEVLRTFDETSSALVAAVNGAPREAWGQTWKLKAGGQVFLSLPRAGALRAMYISHTIHHRGQLTVYLRLLGVPVPGMYGPSADEAFG